MPAGGGWPGSSWWMPRMLLVLTRNMLGRDEPDHRRLRTLVEDAFLRRSVDEMRPRIAALADRFLDDWERAGRRPDGGAADFIRHFARPFPLAVICELLGLPEEDRPKFTRWAGRLTTAGSALGMIGRLARFAEDPRLSAAGIPTVPGTPQARPDLRARGRGAGRRPSRRGRAARDGLPLAVRRPRDDRAPHQRRCPRAARSSRPEGEADGRLVPGRSGRRRGAAVRLAGADHEAPLRQPRPGALRPVDPPRRVLHGVTGGGQLRSRAVRRARAASTSAAAPTRTSTSAPASTSASA